MDEYRLSARQRVLVRTQTSDQLEVEVVYDPGGSPPPSHLHPDQDEHFTILEGTIEFRIDGEQRARVAGDEVTVPRGTTHAMWNPHDTPARALWRTSPTGRTVQWYAALDRLQQAGHVAADGNPKPLAFAMLLDEYRDTIRLAVPGVVVKLMALIGRTRGYRV